MNRLIILGAGGHGKVVADAALLQGSWSSVVFLDDKYPELQCTIGLPVIGRLDALADLLESGDEVVFGVGDIIFRQSLLRQVGQLEVAFATVIHPSSVISPFVEIDSGTVVFASAVINAGAVINEHVIINTAAVVEHDCHVMSGVHVSPAACLGGSVIIEGGVWIGMGASVLPGLTIAEKSIVGAGSVVTRNVSSASILVGVPAKQLVK